MDSPFTPGLKTYLNTLILCENAFRSNNPHIDPYSCFPAFIKNLKHTMSSPQFSKKDMAYCAREIQRLYPNLKPQERTQFESLENRIKIWDEIRANPKIRLENLEKLPAYANKKLQLIQDLLVILHFQDDLYYHLKDFRASQPNVQDEMDAKTVLEFKEIIKPSPRILEPLKILIETFPHLEFILDSDAEDTDHFSAMPMWTTVLFQTMVFMNAYREIQSDQTKFKDYLFSLFRLEKTIEVFRDFTQDELTDLISYQSVQELIERTTTHLEGYIFSNEKLNPLANRIMKIYAEKCGKGGEPAVLARSKTKKSRIPEPKQMRYVRCLLQPSKRIAPLETLQELEDLVSDLELESSLIEKIEPYLSSHTKMEELLTSKNNNSHQMNYEDGFCYRCYLISKSDVKSHPTLSKEPYVKIGATANGEYVLHLKKIENKNFNYKAITRALDLLIKKSSSLNLNAIFQSMKDHVELIRLMQTQSQTIDFEHSIKSIKESHTPYDLTPFLHDAIELTHFFPETPQPPLSFNDPAPQELQEFTQTILERTLEGWNEFKRHQKLLLEHAKKQIIARKKANQSATIKKINSQPIQQTPPKPTSPKKENKVVEITTPKIIKQPIAIARAVIEGRVRAPTILPELYQPYFEVSPGWAPRVIPSITAAPPGEPFPYEKSLDVLKWENHPVGKALTNKYTKLSPLAQEKIHLFHAPHPAVDLFLHLGIQGRFGKNKRIEIMTEIQFNKKTFRGVIGYTFQGDTCTHKCFTSNQKEILKQTWEKLKKQECPKVKTVATALEPKTRYPDLRCYISQDALGNVRIEDTRRDLVIKLFKY